MTRRFEVIGEDGDIIGVSPGMMPVRFGGGPSAAIAPVAPDWRSGQWAPGVQQPAEGLVALPLTPGNGTGIFAVATPVITFSGQLQKPYRPERFIMPAAVRTGASATGILLAQFFVGTDLQGAEIQGLPIETIGAVTAFGTRMSFMQAAPGVLMRLVVTATPAPTGADTITALGLMFLGRVIH